MELLAFRVRLTLHPGDGSALGHRRAGDHAAPAPQAGTREDPLRGWDFDGIRGIALFLGKGIIAETWLLLWLIHIPGQKGSIETYADDA